MYGQGFDLKGRAERGGADGVELTGADERDGIAEYQRMRCESTRKHWEKNGSYQRCCKTSIDKLSGDEWLTGEKSRIE